MRNDTDEMKNFLLFSAYKKRLEGHGQYTFPKFRYEGINSIPGAEREMLSKLFLVFLGTLAMAVARMFSSKNRSYDVDIFGAAIVLFSLTWLTASYLLIDKRRQNKRIGALFDHNGRLYDHWNTSLAVSIQRRGDDLRALGDMRVQENAAAFFKRGFLATVWDAAVEKFDRVYKIE